MENAEKNHISWVDLLRIVACFLVVIAHCCDPFVGQFDSNRPDFLSGVFWGSFVRPCVPLFVMISGVLLLPLKSDMSTFYKRRTNRIIIPLIFWSLVTPVLYYLYLNFGVDTSSPNIVMDDFTWGATMSKLYTFIFNFNYTTIPLWYIYMLIGLYLIMPVISAWLVQASQKDVRWFLYIWGVSMFLPYIQMLAPVLGYTGNYGNMSLLGVCDWNPYGTFYYFSGFLGYIVLAYYLVKYPLNWSWTKTLYIAIPLFLAGYIVTLLGYLYTQKHAPGDYAALEVIWYFSGINVFVMTFSMFIVMQKIKIKPSGFINTVASLTFGIYLCHFIIVQMGYDLIYPRIALPAYLQIPLMAVFVFSISLCIAWLMSKNRLTRKLIM